MRRSALVAIVCLAALTVGRAQTPAEFVGKLEAELAPGRVGSSVAMTPATVEARAKLGALVAAADNVLAGELSFGDGKRPIYLVASGGDGAVITDLNGNGTFEANERVAFAPTTDVGMDIATTLRFSTRDATFANYPVRVGLRKGQLAGLSDPRIATPGPFYLPASYQAFAVGVVPIDGRPVKVQLIANAKDFTVNPSKSYQYLDVNGDGEFDTDFTSWELGYGRGAPVVFHLGDGNRYVSIKGVDPASRTITLAARTAADYVRIELRRGSTLPEFSFKALDGSAHHLAEFRGKYLLIDFWGTWCGPCVGEIPYLKKAYEAYKDKGLEIIGMDNELPDVTAEDFAKGLETVKAFVADKGVTWTQAQTESIKPLYESRFQIVAWPTMILLDPNGVIVSVDRTNKGEPGLRGDKLGQTLAGIFASKQ